MRFSDSIFASVLKPINRRQFQTVVDGLDGDAYDKSFKSWDHLVALVYAQLSGAVGLRGLVAGFNANSQHHYHLGADKLSRSTLADANARRPVGIFAQTFAGLSATADALVSVQTGVSVIGNGTIEFTGGAGIQTAATILSCAATIHRATVALWTP